MNCGAIVLAGAVAALATQGVRAEPAFAVRTGYRCAQCHVNRTGGGMRTAFGSLYTQVVLPARLVRWRDGGNLLPADPDARFGAGADLRVSYVDSRSDDSEDASTFEISEANLYVYGNLLPERLGVYLDETVGPGGASAREAFGLFGFAPARLRGHVRAGKILPAYGWRLPDDAAFIRQNTGFSYQSPDTGVEVGLEPGRWTLVTALTNGSSGSFDDNRAKRSVLQAVRRFRDWRLGVHGAYNRGTDAKVEQAGLLAGASFGRLALLGEGDWVVSSDDDGTERRLIAYIEGDLLVSRGLNVKLVHDWIDPDREVSTDARVRDSLGVEYVPIPFLQLRAFVRRYDGPPQVPGAQDTQVDLELHLFF